MSRYRPASYVSFSWSDPRTGQRASGSAHRLATSAPRLSFCPCSVNSSVPTSCIRRSSPVDVGSSTTGRASDRSELCRNRIAGIGREVAQWQQLCALAPRESGSVACSSVLSRSVRQAWTFCRYSASAGGPGLDVQPAGRSDGDDARKRASGRPSGSLTTGYTHPFEWRHRRAAGAAQSC